MPPQINNSSSAQRSSSKILIRHRCTFRRRLFYSKAIPRDPRQERSLSRCAASFEDRCSQNLPLQDGRADVLVGHLGIERMHQQKRCPCYDVLYGGSNHRWCCGGVHYEGAGLFSQGKEGAESSMLPWKGHVQTRITDFYIET